MFRELGQEYVACAKRRKRFMQAVMGPLPSSTFTIMPPFWVCMGDMIGPFTVYVPGRERATRRMQALDSKAWIMAFICPTTKIINLQVLEGRNSDALCCSLSRLGCELGYPTHFLVDQDSALLKVLSEAEVNLVDTQHKVKKGVGVSFSVCPVAGTTSMAWSRESSALSKMFLLGTSSLLSGSQLLGFSLCANLSNLT